MTPELASRLLNSKFESAVKVLNAIDPHDSRYPDATDRATIASLNAVFGNAGWCDGHMGIIVDAAVRSIAGMNQ